MWKANLWKSQSIFSIISFYMFIFVPCCDSWHFFSLKIITIQEQEQRGWSSVFRPKKYRALRLGIPTIWPGARSVAKLNSLTFLCCL